MQQEEELSPMLKFAQQMQNETVNSIWSRLQQGFVLLEQRTLSTAAWIELYKYVLCFHLKLIWLTLITPSFPNSLVHFFYSNDKNEGTGERMVSVKLFSYFLTATLGIVYACCKFYRGFVPAT